MRLFAFICGGAHKSRLVRPALVPAYPNPAHPLRDAGRRHGTHRGSRPVGLLHPLMDGRIVNEDDLTIHLDCVRYDDQVIIDSWQPRGDACFSVAGRPIEEEGCLDMIAGPNGPEIVRSGPDRKGPVSAGGVNPNDRGLCLHSGVIAFAGKPARGRCNCLFKAFFPPDPVPHRSR